MPGGLTRRLDHVHVAYPNSSHVPESEVLKENASLMPDIETSPKNADVIPPDVADMMNKAADCGNHLTDSQDITNLIKAWRLESQAFYYANKISLMNSDDKELNLAVDNLSAAQERKPATCTENAEFSSCGPACRPTCNDPYPALCESACVKGCFCKPGFVQHTDGRCVRLENCSTTCSHPGEEFQGCGSTCPDTCENRGRHPPASCPYRCVRGCFCRKGLYRTKRGHCVPLKDCDKESYFTTTAKPTMTREYTDLLPVDCHGCPNRVECEAYCRTLGDFIGLCIGSGRLHCRCA